MVVRIVGKHIYLWRAVDDEGEVLDMLVQKRRNTKAALKLRKSLFKNQDIHPESPITDGLGPYRAAACNLNLSA
jgi:putative transposase